MLACLLLLLHNEPLCPGRHYFRRWIGWVGQIDTLDRGIVRAEKKKSEVWRAGWLLVWSSARLSLGQEDGGRDYISW